MEGKPPGFRVDILDTKFDVKFFAVLPTLFASYGFQGSYFTAYASLKNKTNKRGILADFYGRILLYVILNATIFIAFGLYGDKIEKNLLKTLSFEDGILPAFLEAIFLLVPALAIPIIFFMGKEAALVIFDEITRKSYSKQNKAQTDKLPQPSTQDVISQPIPSQEDIERNNSQTKNLPKVILEIPVVADKTERPRMQKS